MRKPTQSKPALMAAGTIVISLALAACGKKGDVNPPADYQNPDGRTGALTGPAVGTQS